MKKIILLILFIAIAATTTTKAQTNLASANTTKTSVANEYKDAFSRMDSSKIAEVISTIEANRAATEQSKVFWESTNGNPGKMVMIFPFIMIILIILIVQYFRYKKKKELYQLMTKFIESGKEVPIELIKEPKKQRSDLRRGLIFLSLGIAITIGAALATMDKLYFIGIIPLLLGIAYILSHFLIKNKDAN